MALLWLTAEVWQMCWVRSPMRQSCRDGRVGGQGEERGE